MGTRKRRRGDDGLEQRLREELRGAPEEVLETMRAGLVEVELLSKLGELEQLASQLVDAEPRLRLRQLCAVLRAALAARDSPLLDVLERAAAKVTQGLEESADDTSWLLASQGFKPRDAGRKIHTTEAQQMLGALARGMNRYVIEDPLQSLAADFVDGLQRTTALSSWCKHWQKGDDEAARTRVCRAFESFSRAKLAKLTKARGTLGPVDLATFEEAVIRGLNALGAPSVKTRSLFDARRKKEGRPR